MAMTLLYVHGAGSQPPALQLLASFNNALFGAQPKTTQIAYYADICWGPGGPGAAAGAGAGPAAGPAAGAGAGAQGAVDAAIAQAVLGANPVAVGQTLLGLIQPGGIVGNLANAALGALGLGAHPAGGGLGAGLGAEAAALLGSFVHGADSASAGVHGAAVPDPLFRAAAAKAGMDVARYLFEPQWRDQMRKRVRDIVGAMPGPFVIVAHSLGTIITYDVLSDPALSNREIRLLATVGSPLGIANVMPHLRNDQGPGTIPSEIESWANFNDPFDPVAYLGHTLSDKYQPTTFVHDVTSLNNPAPDNHALEGYLGLGPIKETVRRILRY